MFSVEPKLYQTNGFLREILLLVAGSDCFFSQGEKAGAVEVQYRDASKIYPWLIVYPDEKENLSQLINKAQMGQPIVILWKRKILQSIDKMQRDLLRLGLVQIEMAYVLPDWTHPTHVVTEGRALNAFYHIRQHCFDKRNFFNLIKRFAYRNNLIKWTEKSIICWATVK